MNEVGTGHSVSASVTGAEDAAIQLQVDVGFEVYRDVEVANGDVTPGDPVEEGGQATGDGEAEFTCTGLVHRLPVVRRSMSY